jgi:anti-sigma factor RsiW
VTQNDFTDRDHVQHLMMAALDGEISADEQRELDGLIAEQPDIAHEWQRFVRLKEVTTGMSLRTPPEETWDRYWHSTYRRAERGLGWLLVSIGAIILGGYWAWHAVEAFFDASSEPLGIRIAIAALAIGLVILAVSVVREKIFTNRRDPYQKEIIR